MLLFYMPQYLHISAIQQATFIEVHFYFRQEYRYLSNLLVVNSFSYTLCFFLLQMAGGDSCDGLSFPCGVKQETVIFFKPENGLITAEVRVYIYPDGV